MKVRSYVYLTPEDGRLLAEHFEVLDSRDGAEIVIIPHPMPLLLPSISNFNYYLDKKYYPDLKIIASQGQRENFIRGTSDGRNIQVIALGEAIVSDLIRGGRVSEKYLVKVKN